MSARIGVDSEPRGLPRLPLADVTNKTAAGQLANDEGPPLDSSRGYCGAASQGVRRREADRLRKAAKRKSADNRKPKADATQNANRLRVAEMRESEEYARVTIGAFR